MVEEGDTDTAPFGMGTYASRSTPVAGAAVAMVSRKIRAKARRLAAHLLEVSEEDVEWELGRFYVRSAPDRGVTIQECAMAAYSNMPDGMEPGLENTAYYDPPNLTWPFACYIVTVEVDPETGVWDVLKMVAVDDCGVRINPMIVEGQIMGGLTEAYAMANMQFITFDADGNCVGVELHGLPAADRLGDARLRAAQRGRHPVPASPDRRQGHRRVRRGGRPGGASSTRSWTRSSGTGVRNIDMPLLPDRVWEAITYRRDVSGAAGARRTTDMEGLGVLEEMGELTRRGEPLRASPPWSGGRALLQPGRARARSSPPGGELHGWIGGACAEPVVISEAQQVMAEGTARLLLLGTPEQFGAAVPDGMTVIPISCQSEGALEVYIEPVLLVPHLVIVEIPDGHGRWPA